MEEEPLACSVPELSLACLDLFAKMSALLDEQNLGASDNCDIHVFPTDTRVGFLSLLYEHFERYTRHQIPMVDFAPGLEWFNVSRDLCLSDFSDRLTVLDFFTYCCVNCLHLLPLLNRLEQRYHGDNRFALVGVHSAKFENERDSDALRAALSRHSIEHPVVNDAGSAMWRALGISCWPTLLVLGSDRNPLLVFVGESYRRELTLCVQAILLHRFYDALGPVALPLSVNSHLAADSFRLHFPGKVTTRLGGGLIVSDTAYHRIILTDYTGLVLAVIGCGKRGFKDCELSHAEFSSPQGCVSVSRHVFLVADTGNHAVRRVCLVSGLVSTLAGTGQQSTDIDASLQGLSSPWDICLASSPDRQDLVQCPDKNLVLIAAAGSHQIWGLYLQQGQDFMGRTHSAGVLVCLAGTGREENRSTSYPLKSSFAQPSGLCTAILHLPHKPRTLTHAVSRDTWAVPRDNSLVPSSFVPPDAPSIPPPAMLPRTPPPPPPLLYPGAVPPPPPLVQPPATSSAFMPGASPLGCRNSLAGVSANHSNQRPLVPVECCLVADAESSSVRCIRLDSGSVLTLVGGSKDPTDLFAYGDADGPGVFARLQHPLGVAADSKGVIYVADTYNHKELREPGGLCVAGDVLYIADTNNHRIVGLNLQTFFASTVSLDFSKLVLGGGEDTFDCVDNDAVKTRFSVVLAASQEAWAKEIALEVQLQLRCNKSDKLNFEAPNNWKLFCKEDLLVSSTKTSGSLHHNTTVDLQLKANSLIPGDDAVCVEILCSTYLCLESGVCVPRKSLLCLSLFAVNYLDDNQELCQASDLRSSTQRDEIEERLNVIVVDAKASITVPVAMFAATS